jgi:hypothetical protein
VQLTQPPLLSGICPTSAITKQLITTSPCSRTQTMCIQYRFVLFFIPRASFVGFFAWGKSTPFPKLAQFLYI